jgi:GDP-L-fucose synthase
MWVLEDYNEKDNIILSVSEKEEVSIGHIANIIATEFGYSHRLVFDSKYSDGQFKKTADNTKLMTHIKDFNNTDINDGIKKTIQYFIENYDNIRK